MSVSISRYERLARIVIDTVRLRAQESRPSRCDWCGTTEELLLWEVAPSGGIVHVCTGCGDMCGCTPVPPCPYAPVGCGAAPGQYCEPGCPQADLDGVPNPSRWW